MTPRRLGAAALALVLCAGAVVGCTGDDGRSGDAQGPGGRPNIVFLLTDDQTAESLRAMPLTRTLLVEQGATFNNAIISYPLCCPSRATLLSGQYSHNNGVEENVPPHGGVLAFDDTEALPVWLQRAGYATSHVGKYLNGYGEVSPATVPRGWDDWFGLQDPSTYGYLDYTVSIDGTLQRFQGESAYQTDVLTDRAVAEINRLSQDDQPFFLNVWYTAPHGGRDLAVPSPSVLGGCGASGETTGPSATAPPVEFRVLFAGDSVMGHLAPGLATALGGDDRLATRSVFQATLSREVALDALWDDLLSEFHPDVVVMLVG